MDEQKTVEIVIEYDAKHSSAYFRYEQFIRKNIEAGNKIPARVLKKFLSLIRVKRDREQSEINVLVERAKQPVIHRFSNDPDYKFSCKGKPEYNWNWLDDLEGDSPTKKKRAKKVEYTFDSLMTRVFSGLRTRLASIKSSDAGSDKEALIEYVYGEISHYCSLPDINPYTAYKQAVLTSYIVFQFEYYLSDKLKVAFTQKREPANHDLYEAVKYYINKIKRKGKGKQKNGVMS